MKAKETHPEIRQTESKAKLKQQQHELREHLQKPAAQSSLNSKSHSEQKLTQINEALKQNGEIDPAFRLNEKYRKGSQNPQTGE